MNISDAVFYVGCDDTTLDLFESQYPVPHGVSYNSYVILDEKTAVMDTVDQRASEEWIQNVERVLSGRKPDYLIISHLEPDHSANIAALADRYPEMTLIGSAKTKAMIGQFFEEDLASRVQAVSEGEELSLGSHTLHFVMAPMVHWPEVMVTYEESEQILFSADAFGTFGALAEKEEWIAEARRYYINIVGKYGAPVLGLLKKAQTLDIKKILPLHGPVLEGDLSCYMDKYKTWASYQPEENGIVLCCASIHGNTKQAALAFADELRAAGQNVIFFDLTRCDMAEAVEAAFRYDRLLLAACTYDGNLFPVMEDFLYHLEIKAFQNRTVGLIENGSWGPMAAKLMTAHLEKMKNITILPEKVTIKTTRKTSDQPAFDALLKAISQK